METLKEQQEFIAEIMDITPLTHDILREYGFIEERKRNQELDVDGHWYKSFLLHEDSWNGSFAYATMVRGESRNYKSGHSIDTVGRLKALYFGVTGRRLEKAPIPNKL